MVLLLLVISIGSLLTLFFQRSTMPTSGISSYLTRLFHKLLTRALGVKIKITGTPNKEATLFISNHISWLDILIIGQIIPTHFLSMIEVKSWPVAGWLSTRAGTLYIHRGGHKATAKSINEISYVLSKKHNVVIFPEGRTTDGSLKKFHSHLMQSVIDADALMQPIALKYLNGGSILANTAVLFNGNTTLLQSLLNIMSKKNIAVNVTFLNSISVKQQSRSEITGNAESQIRKRLKQD